MIGGRFFRGYKKGENIKIQKKNKSCFFCGEIIESISDLNLGSERQQRDFAFDFLFCLAPEIHRLSGSA